MINSILAGIRYWQRRADSILAGRLLPILAGGIAILAGSLACSGPSWAITQTPTPILAGGAGSAPSPSQAPAVSGKAKTELRATVSAIQALNVRAKPTKKSAGLGTLLSGAEVSLTGECAGAWAQILYKAGRAWVDGRYLAGDPCKEE
jgi:uncharacterized protein YgiM (DUF1202 family)